MNDNEENVKYEQIINLPHHVSDKHTPMSMSERAAQFAPFAALTGYHGMVSEASRRTGDREDLDDDRKAMLDERLIILSEKIYLRPEVTVCHFIRDRQKEGGEYAEKTGSVKHIDMYEKKLIFTDSTEIMISDIYDISGDIFAETTDQ